MVRLVVSVMVVPWDSVQLVRVPFKFVCTMFIVYAPSHTAFSFFFSLFLFAMLRCSKAASD